MSDGERVAWPLPASMPSLAASVPPAPAGTLFVLSEQGGYAVVPRRFDLLFGRERDDVHVPVGTDDPHVSRLHGRIAGDGGEWWMHNTGRLPIRLPRGGLLLSGHEMRVRAGYLPLLIGVPEQREHLVEVRVVGRTPPVEPQVSGRRTAAPAVHELSPVERLVLASLAQRYLRNEPNPQPVTWRQVTDDVNRVLPDADWIPKTAQNVVTRIRLRLAEGPAPIPGIRAEEVGHPLGNTLNDNLIRALLENTTLMPSDVRLLADPDD